MKEILVEQTLWNSTSISWFFHWTGVGITNFYKSYLWLFFFILQLSIHDRTQTIVAPMFLWSVVISQIFSMASFFVLPLQLGQLNNIFVRFRKLTNSKEGSVYILGWLLRIYPWKIYRGSVLQILVTDSTICWIIVTNVCNTIPQS